VGKLGNIPYIVIAERSSRSSKVVKMVIDFRMEESVDIVNNSINFLIFFSDAKEKSPFLNTRN
jgi:hypothetical protein